jgi:hypothetical protein
MVVQQISALQWHGMDVIKQQSIDTISDGQALRVFPRVPWGRYGRQTPRAL